MFKFPGIKDDVSTHVQTKNHVTGLLRTKVILGVSTVHMSQLYSVYPIYLTLARLVGSERYLICEKQANIGQVNATIYLVSLSLSREITVINGPEFS